MNKRDFFNSCSLKTSEFQVSDDLTLPLHELTLQQRAQCVDLVESNPVKSQANIVVMGCDFLDDSDIPELLKMGHVVTDIYDEIMRLSGIGKDASEAIEKNLDSGRS